MISFYTVQNTGDKQYIEGFCKSTDTKPTTGIANGSCLVEVDNGDCYLFDEDGSAWCKIGGES